MGVIKYNRHPSYTEQWHSGNNKRRQNKRQVFKYASWFLRQSQISKLVFGKILAIIFFIEINT